MTNNNPPTITKHINTYTLNEPLSSLSLLSVLPPITIPIHTTTLQHRVTIMTVNEEMKMIK